MDQRKKSGVVEENTMVREITENDFDGLLRLYMQLHDNPFPEKNDIKPKEVNSDLYPLLALYLSCPSGAIQNTTLLYEVVRLCALPFPCGWRRLEI